MASFQARHHIQSLCAAKFIAHDCVLKLDDAFRIFKHVPYTTEEGRQAYRQVRFADTFAVRLILQSCVFFIVFFGSKYYAFPVNIVSQLNMLVIRGADFLSKMPPLKRRSLPCIRLVTHWPTCTSTALFIVPFARTAFVFHTARSLSLSIWAMHGYHLIWWTRLSNFPRPCTLPRKPAGGPMRGSPPARMCGPWV